MAALYSGHLTISVASASAMNEHSASRGRLAFIHGFTTGNWYYLYSNWDSLVLQRISLLLPQCHVDLIDLIDLISTVANHQDTLPNALDLLSPRHTLHRSCLCFKLRLFVNAHRGEEVKSLPFSARIYPISPEDRYEPMHIMYLSQICPAGYCNRHDSWHTAPM